MLSDNEELSSQNEGNDSSVFLILDNDADKENIYIGQYVTWIISVINTADNTAKNVNVYDQLPDGLKYVSHTTTKGTFNPDTGMWNIGELSLGDNEVFLYITTQAVATGEMINKATLTTDSINLNENESYEEEEIDVFEWNDPYSTQLNANQTANPFALAILSVFGIFLTSFSRFRK